MSKIDKNARRMSTGLLWPSSSRLGRSRPLCYWTLCSWVLVCCLLLSLTAVAQQSRSARKIDDLRPTVLLISIDGFRADYLDKTPSPTLHKLAAAGASGSLIPCFPSKTFPNHYSI